MVNSNNFVENIGKMNIIIYVLIVKKVRSREILYLSRKQKHMFCIYSGKGTFLKMIKV